MTAIVTGLKNLWGKRVETTDRAVLLWIRWLFFLVLTMLFLYNYSDQTTPVELWTKCGLLAFYGVSNVLLAWATRNKFSTEKWGIPLFILDMTLVGLTLYHSTTSDADLYVMCFLIVYLAALGRRVREAVPLAMTVSFLYGWILLHRGGEIEWMDPRLLLRFPFFLVLSLFTSHLSEQSDRHRLRIERMQQVQSALSQELQRVLVDLRNKQTALVQAEKMSAMGHMAGALAHEIRNPLSVIVGYVEDILADRNSEDPLWRPLEAVKRSATRCKELMENLLTFSRQPRERETFKLKDALQEAITLVRMSAKMTQVQCNLDVHADPIMIARRSEVQQVFVNLMGNGLDAMPKGGTLTVRLEEETLAGQDWIKVAVQDTGEGIPPEVRARIFEPFFTTKPRGKGTGLGLSIVQDIVRSYKGVLEVESQLHQGTTFIVRFPKNASAEMPAEEGAAAPSEPTQSEAA